MTPYHPFSSPNKHLVLSTKPLWPNVILIVYLYICIIASLIPLRPPMTPFHPFSSPNKHLILSTKPLLPNVIVIVYLYGYIITSLIPLRTSMTPFYPKLTKLNLVDVKAFFILLQSPTT